MFYLLFRWQNGIMICFQSLEGFLSLNDAIVLFVVNIVGCELCSETFAGGETGLYRLLALGVNLGLAVFCQSKRKLHGRFAPARATGPTLDLFISFS